ncbi:MAG: FxLYD domain-containing protein [Nitrososphaeraceae archaeon]
MLRQLTVIILFISLAMAVTPTVYAQTTEDDGYTYPDDASEEEKQEIDEQERHAWEDAGRPGDNNNNSNDDDDGNDSRDNDDGVSSNSGDIAGTVQNISEPVNLLSHNAREDGGYLHVVGEVENGLGRVIDYVKVTGTFYEANNQVIGTDFVFTDPSSLEAGETVPFDLTLFTDAVDPSQVSSYKIRVSWQ